ncbi:MAG: hypothetical protein ACM3ML_32285 [Micromonosporaceae bacterium]
MRFLGASGLVAGALAVMTGLAVPGLAASGPVSPTPAKQTPQLTAYNGTTVEIVRQLVQCGGTMYAVGSFTTIKRNTTTYTRHNIFSFSATSPFAVTSWDPNVNGVVNSIAFNGTNCSTAYIGGKFTSVHGTAVKNIAAISTSTGAVVTTFRHNANGMVETLLAAKGHILAGGYFTSINGTVRWYMASLNPTTGKDDAFIHGLNISGNYQFPGVGNNATRIYNQQLSHSGNLDLVEGDFTSVGGLGRQQIFMLDLSGSSATVTKWTSPEWDGSVPQTTIPYQCWTSEPFYLQAAAWSPDDSAIYIGTTGFHPWNLPKGTYPRSGLCDAAAAFPATQTSVRHIWVNYTGCDSLFAAAADAGAAYFGGHERWSQNPNDCDAKGPGAIVDPGMEGLNPATGADLLNSQGAALYTRGRGLGADDMLVTSAGLWIASDNFNNANYCGGVSGHAGICFLPYG